LSPIIKLDFGLGYHKKEITNIVRVEASKFKVCEPAQVRTKRYGGLFGEITWIVHVLDKKGKFRLKRLN